jgi:hypothetical protein
MTTRSDIRARVRAELGDETLGAYVWSDVLLDSHIAAGLRRCGFDLPAEAETAIMAISGVTVYPLPADCLRVIKVEHPAGTILRRGSATAGDNWTAPVMGRENAWEEYAHNLVLMAGPSADETVIVRYLRLYGVPADDSAELDIPGADEDLIVWLVCETALVWLKKQKDKRLDRRAGFLYPDTYAKRYQEAVRVRKRVRGAVSRTMA